MSLSYAHGACDIPLLGETIGATLTRAAETHPDGEALVECATGRRYSYRALEREVDTLARGLLAAGITAGDRVGIWAPNCAEWVLVQFATARIGAILVNVNPAYRTHELAFVLNQSGIRTLISAARYRSSDYAGMIESVREQCPALEDVVLLGDRRWAELLAGADRVSPADLTEATRALSFDDPINIQYTSGTTGSPKGATLTHHNILNNGYMVGELVGYSAADRICIPVPFYHCFGMVMGNLAAVSHAATMVIPAPTFDPAATLAAVATERCSSLYGVPTMFIAELGLPGFSDYDLTSLRTGIMAGSNCPIEVMRRVVTEMHMDEVSICYGMTETSPVSTQTRVEDPLERRVATVGRPGPHIEVKIVDPQTGRILPRGETGEFCTRGYSVMTGYWEEPAKTAEVIDAAGWMHTGDLATMDDEGYCAIVGRIKDMVIRGGENLYPREIEEFLYTHPAIADVQVVGVPDPLYGEELCAWVRRQPDTVLDADGVQAFCRGRLAHQKVPRYVLFVEEFPMTVTGKVQKFEMRRVSVERLSLRLSPESAAAS
ncbi:AMP-binding protein [Conexibacter sp. DBS9H8]|uniref:AMP-binding protein n=1 Tax=Conexibacter sp. DBS9H8 TaxID=2937801 RepID=UPI00200CE3D0|nr:AMP-binding protein [Conexibacter sp. DBS9H8]